jgi:DNA-binding transcriptional LysR family regulator
VIGALSLGVASLKTAHPRLDVRLLSARSDELAVMVQDGEVDIAAVVARPDDALPDTLRWTPLYTEPLMLIVNRDVLDNDPQRILNAHGFLRFDRRVRTGRVVDQALQSVGLSVHEYLELNSIETIVALVRRNVGVTVLPQLHRAGWQADPSLRLIDIAQPAILRTVGLIERASYGRSGIAAAIPIAETGPDVSILARLLCFHFVDACSKRLRRRRRLQEPCRSSQHEHLRGQGVEGVG